MKSVTVQLPDWIWGPLASMADRRHVQVGDIIADAILDKVGPKPSPLEQLQDELRAARKSGYRAPRR